MVSLMVTLASSASDSESPGTPGSPMPPSPGSPAFRLPWRVSCRGLALNREESGGASVPTSPLWGPPDNTKALCRGRLPPVIPISVPVQVIKDLKGSDYSWSYQTPPSSPSGSGSRKSSMCRSVRG